MRDWLRRTDRRIAASLRGFGPAGILYLLSVLAVGAFVENVFAFALVLVWLLLSHTRLSDIGVRWPSRPFATFAICVLAGIALKLFLAGVVMPGLRLPMHNPLMDTVRGNGHAFWVWSFRVIVFGGVVEEVIYRGYLLNRLTAVWGSGILALASMVGVSALVFGVPHYLEQGLPGAVNATFGGVILATIYLASGRQLLPVVVIHAANDLCAVWLAYAGLNDALAHAIWR